MSIDKSEFDSDEFYDEFKEQHSGHEKEVEGGFNKTVRYSHMGISKPTDAEAHCPKCEVTEKVIYHDRICPHHEYGEHIDLVCENCGEEGTTKNIKYIGARGVFVSCSCPMGDLTHVCDHE